MGTRLNDMTDLKNPKLIWMKGGLFLFLGCMSSVILLVQLRTLTGAVLLAITVWAFCRAYYFAFYVIQHYVDPAYRFAGLVDFARYALARRRHHR